MQMNKLWSFVFLSTSRSRTFKICTTMLYNKLFMNKLCVAKIFFYILCLNMMFKTWFLFFLFVFFIFIWFSCDCDVTQSNWLTETEAYKGEGCVSVCERKQRWWDEVGCVCVGGGGGGGGASLGKLGRIIGVKVQLKSLSFLYCQTVSKNKVEERQQ